MKHLQQLTTALWLLVAVKVSVSVGLVVVGVLLIGCSVVVDISVVAG